MVTLLKTSFSSVEVPLDYEEFIIENCSIKWENRISYADFFTEFVEWKKKEIRDYNLDYKYKKEIQSYLEKHFAGGRVHLSDTPKTTHLFGVWGLGLKSSGGLKVKKRTCKGIEQVNTETKEIIKSYESLSLASRELNIPISTLSNYCRFGTNVNGCVFRYDL